MHIIVDRILRGFFRRLEQRPHIHVKPDVGKGRGNHLRPPVMPILAHLHDQHPRPATLRLGKGLHVALDRLEPRIALISRAIDPGEGLNLGPMPPEYLFHGVRNLPDRGPRPGRLHRRFQKVATLTRPPRQLRQRRLNPRLIA